jgi:ligand-binding sensor domain-containing protein
MANNKHFQILLLTLIFSTAVFILSPRDTQAGDTFLPGEEKIWTSWRANHYTLIDDGPILWIGTGSGLTRYEKESGQHTRYATPDGFPHRQVFSGAVAGDGNRWFGGEGGLSRLDADQQWTHYDMDNSDIHNNYVIGIAVSTGGDVWLSHWGSSQISHRLPDGTWQIFDNREAAVSATYTAVKETTNKNDLWAVSGNEVWVGYNVYDGVQWQTRRPEGAFGDPQNVAADRKGTIWALDYEHVYRWQENMWSMYPVDEGAILYTLAIDATDKVWVGGDKPVYGAPVSLPDEPAFTSLPENPGSFTLDQIIDFPPPLVDLLPTAEGLWVTGDNWLLKADGESVVFSDVPNFNFYEFFIDRHGIRRLSSDNGTLQIFDDMGTATIKDDIWSFDDSMEGPFDNLELVENGDFWMGGKDKICFKYCTPWIARYHDGQAIDYEQPDWYYDFLNYDIFSEDSRHTWFVFAEQYWDGYYRIPVIYHLDDGGTPANHDDDVWTEYPTPADAHKEFATNYHLVAAGNGRLWYGHPSGIYQKKSQNWELISAKTPYEFVMAKDGSLIVNTGEGKVLIISPNGQQVVYTIACLVASRPELVRSTIRRNQMWTVAADGAIWYWNDQGQLVRWHELGVQTFDTPVEDPYIEVDRNNHVWLNYRETLWRVSPKPDFDISSGPSTWLMMSSESRSGIITAVDISGYAEEIELSISDLPPGVSADIAPEVVHAGKTAVLTLASKDVPLGEYTFVIKGASGEKVRSRTVKLFVVEEVHTHNMPLVVQGY